MEDQFSLRWVSHFWKRLFEELGAFLWYIEAQCHPCGSRIVGHTCHLHTGADSCFNEKKKREVMVKQRKDGETYHCRPLTLRIKRMAFKVEDSLPSFTFTVTLPLCPVWALWFGNSIYFDSFKLRDEFVYYVDNTPLKVPRYCEGIKHLRFSREDSTLY